MSGQQAVLDYARRQGGLVVDIFSRWLHILVAVVAVGGLIYARLIVTPSLKILSTHEREKVQTQLSARFRPIVIAVIAISTATGSYNLLGILQEGVANTYHMAFGIKFLLALHIFGMLFLISAPPSGSSIRDAKRSRLMTGAVISGLIVLALGAYLRTLHS